MKHTHISTHGTFLTLYTVLPFLILIALREPVMKVVMAMMMMAMARWWWWWSAV